jgi:glycerol-3-phosphate dehydrogenase (NAD(P)+)
MREVVRKVGRIKQKTIILSAAKGIEEGSLRRMSEVIREELPESKVCVLSGPSHAEEVSRNIPTTVVVSSIDHALAKDMQKVFMTNSLRVYTNSDVVGVELGGALKNIVAIAAGISDGLGFGDNTKAAILTRGLAEITRLGVAMGASPATFAGLTGMGDLVTKCISQFSRNIKLGDIVAQGKSLDEALSIIGLVGDGVRTTGCAYKLAGINKVDVPITEQIHAVLFEGKDARSAASDLMVRTPRPELEEEFLGMSKP